MGAEHSTASHSNRQRGMPAYSRHTGKNMGSHTHYKGDRIGHPSSNLIGRTRVTKVNKSYSVCFYVRWNLDKQWTAKGPAKYARYDEVSLYWGSFPYFILFLGPGKLLHRGLRFIEVRLIEVPLYTDIEALHHETCNDAWELHFIVLGSSYVFPPCSKHIALWQFISFKQRLWNYQ